MLGIFKSKETRRRERWVCQTAEKIQAFLRNAWFVESTTRATPDQFSKRLFDESFAGYLVGFADVLVREFAEDVPTYLKYCRMLFDGVLTPRGGEWVAANLFVLFEDREAAPSELSTGFNAGWADARDSSESNRLKLTRLRDVFFREKGLAA